MNGLMWLILHHISVRRDHLPAVTTCQEPAAAAKDDVLSICYPFEIKVFVSARMLECPSVTHCQKVCSAYAFVLCLYSCVRATRWCLCICVTVYL